MIDNTNKEWAKYWYNRRLKNLNVFETPCGEGSTPASTTIIKRYIGKLVKSLDIKSVSDAPCGLFNLWMHDVDYGNAKYVGYDINDEVIERNRREFPNIEFHEFDIVNEVLPKSDLIICRDCLFHLPGESVLRALENFRKSGSKYLLATNHNQLAKNEEVRPLPGTPQKEASIAYGYRRLNISLEPFGMGKPIDFIEERKWNRQFCLWELQ